MMSSSRLDWLFGDLTKRRYGLVSKEALAVCRNDFNQMLKLAEWDDIETPSLKRLLQDADNGFFTSAASMVHSAQIDYTNLNKKIKEVNKIKEQKQQKHVCWQKIQVCGQLPTNTHLRQNEEQNTGIQRSPQTFQQSFRASQYPLYGNPNTPLKPTVVGPQYLNKSEANILINNTSVTSEHTVRPQDTMTYSQASNSNRVSDTNSTFQREQVHVTQPPNITQVQGSNPTKIYSNNLLDGCLNNVNKDYLHKEQDLSMCRLETAMSKTPTGIQSTVTTLDRKNTEDFDPLHNISNETASTYAVSKSEKTTSSQNNAKTDTNTSNQVHNKDMTNHSTNTRTQQPRTGNCNDKESEASKLSRSRAASAKLRKNNPNIVDLSDNNRPTKLAEKFCEMYDNEWTEAFECLDTNCKQQEKTIIGLLLDIVTKSFQFSKTETVRMVKIMENAFDSVLERGNVGHYHSEVQTKARKSDTSMLEQYLKDNASRAVPRLQREFSEKLPVIYRNFYVKDVPVSPGNPIVTYANRCVELTWWMCVQDPPIYMDTAESMMMPMFNAATYKAYTKTGQKIDYYVWPALLLEQDGAVLMKGVAQCV